MTTLPSPIRLTALLAVAVFAGRSALHADGGDDQIQTLRQQIQQLDQKLKVLERNEEIKDEDAAVAAKTAPKLSISDKGFTFASADGANSVSIRGLVQLDSRLFFNDGGGLVNNSFVLRRARLISEGTFDKIFSFQLVPEFGGGTNTGASAVSILDANLTIAPSKELQFKVGKFKAPVGLELLQSDSWTFFVERSLVSNLVPNRDLGVQVGGSFADGILNYAAGVFNGVADGANSNNADYDNDKEGIARVFAQPFKNLAGSPVQGLSFGVAGSDGREKSLVAGGSPLTAGYKTDGQQTFFKYKSTVVTSGGQLWRVSPQADYRYGPVGVIAEYVVSTDNVRSSATAPKTALENKAWEVAAGYVLTGEDSSLTGVVPKAPFNWDNGTWGAWEVVARYADLKLDPKTFPLFADATAGANVNAKEAASAGLGLNWYLSRTVRISADYFQTQFTNSVAPAAATQLLRQDEKAFITRFQVAF
jgi:phosphate-selective porin OprO/OprP